MRTYVINLPRSAARRDHITRHLSRLGLPYEFIEAVDGRALTQSDRARLVDEAAVARFPHWLTPGQIGCSLSHRRAYEQIIADRQEIAFVTEDDVVLPPDTSALLDELAAHMRGSEGVLLYFRSFEPCVFSSQDAITLSRGRRLMYPLDVRQPITTAAYLISRAACEKLVDLILPVRAGADSWGFFHENGAVDRLRCVVPRPAEVRRDFKSTIDYVGPRSLQLRVTTTVSERRIFPFHQLLTWKRSRLERRMTRTIIRHDRSPLAGPVGSGR